MDVPIQVSFRYVPYDAALVADIHARATRLVACHRRILNCHVALERPHHSQTQGDRCHVRIELAVPGELLIITHEPAPLTGHGDDETHESVESAVGDRDLPAAVREAFDDARQRLEEYVRQRRSACTRGRHVETHEHEGSAEAAWPRPTHVVSSLVH